MASALSAVAQLGVNVKDATGAFRSTSAILDECADKWDNLTENEKADFCTSVVGKRALMHPVDDYSQIVPRTEACIVSPNENDVLEIFDLNLPQNIFLDKIDPN